MGRHAGPAGVVAVLLLTGARYGKQLLRSIVFIIMYLRAICNRYRVADRIVIHLNVEDRAVACGRQFLITAAGVIFEC